MTHPTPSSEQPSDRAFEIVSEWLRSTGKAVNGPALHAQCLFADFVLARASLPAPTDHIPDPAQRRR